jgi:hypothetical protein
MAEANVKQQWDSRVIQSQRGENEMNLPMKHVFRMSLAAGLFLLGSIQLHASIVCCPKSILGAPLFDFVDCGGIPVARM